MTLSSVFLAAERVRMKTVASGLVVEKMEFRYEKSCTTNRTCFGTLKLTFGSRRPGWRPSGT